MVIAAQPTALVPNDSDLLRAFSQGDRDSFDVLVSRYRRFVVGVCLRETGDADLAQDAAQLVFLTLARKARRVNAAVPLTGWLYKVSRDACRDLVRARRRQERREKEAASAPKGEGRELHEALDGLTGRERDLILWHFYEERSYREIGDLLGIQEDAVRMRVKRSLEKLKRRLSPAALLLLETGRLPEDPLLPMRLPLQFAPAGVGALATWALVAAAGLVVCVPVAAPIFPARRPKPQGRRPV